ncbi:MAG: prepilin peptidase [Planctomycetota bacterium]|nr:prepilin peptidase [Planctomycetota bacterium]
MNLPDLSPLRLTLAAIPPAVLLHLPTMVFIFCFGACVGSFINVVIYRLPAGMSVISPPSRCPTCGARLKFFRENLPILGWFLVRGRCLHCRAPVSPRYMIIELLMALLFLGLYAVLYTVSRTTPWWGEIGGPWWTSNTFFRTWPVFVAFAFMLAALVAMTVIDAETFMIPLEIPTFVTLTAFVAYPLQSILPHRTPTPPAGTTIDAWNWPIHGVNWQWFLTACGGMLGVLIALVLLRLGMLRASFADYDKFVKDDQPLAEYPHARREMRVELVFLLPCMIGLIAGYFLGGWLPSSAPPELAQAVGGVFLGYLVGGGLVWAIRILGTLAFGREAMGLGDVHLLAAVGAVLGWFDPILIFFIAPFSGLIWARLSTGLSKVFRMVKRQLPFGPHLAVATLIVLLGRPGLAALWRAYFPPTQPIPARGLVEGGGSGPPSSPSGPGRSVPRPQPPPGGPSAPSGGADNLTLQPVPSAAVVACRRALARPGPHRTHGGAGLG